MPVPSSEGDEERRLGHSKGVRPVIAEMGLDSRA
jgi:hypothetical protein